MKKLYEGKAKIIYQTEDENILRQYFKDDVTAFNKKKFSIIKNKGILNNLISAHLMSLLSQKNIKNHFIKMVDDRNQLIEKLTIIPLEVIVRNKVAGSMANKLAVAEGLEIKDGPIIEICYKRDDLGDPVISDDEAIKILSLVSKLELSIIKNYSKKINKILTKLMHNIDIDLIDFKLEFGRNETGKIILADEISPDSCRLWDQKTGAKMDKDLFRKNLGDLVGGYKEIAKRLGIDVSNF